jgi:hypothetical protein
MSSHLGQILRRLNAASHKVARTHGLKRHPVSPVNAPMTERDQLAHIREHICFLEAPELSYLMFSPVRQARRSAGQPNCAPRCAKN